MERDLTKGNVKNHYLKYLVASFGSAMIGCIYAAVDAAVVGHYAGPVGSATLSVVLPIWTIIYSLGLLIGIGGSVCYSFYKGKGEQQTSNEYFTFSVVLATVSSIICWIIVVFFDEPMLRLFGADDELLPLAQRYLLPIKFVIPVYLFSEVTAAFLRNDNAPSLATKAIILGGIFNVGGDFMFVFVFDLGFFGAGLATALGMTFSQLIMLTHFLSKQNTLRLVKLKNRLQKAKAIFVNGFSSFVTDMAMGIVAIFFNRQIMHYFDSDALSVFGVITQISVLVQCSTYGAGQAAQPIISVNYGADLKERVKKTNQYGVITVLIFGIFWASVMLLFPNVVLNLYMSPTESVLKIAPEIIRIYGISYLLLPLNIYATYYFQSVMKPKISLGISLLRGFVICVVLVLLLPVLFGKGAIWWVMLVTEFLVSIYVLLNMKSCALK